MKSKLEIFRRDFLNANTWGQRKDGVPLYLLDELSKEELRIAEEELLDVLSLNDDWPIRGLGYIKSEKAKPKLYELLSKSKKAIKVIIAHSIFWICGDEEMVDVTLVEMPKISNQYVLIDLVYLLKGFNDKRTDDMLDQYRNHKEYLVAYNATQAMGLPTERVVEKFRRNRRKSGSESIIRRLKRIFNIL